MAKEPERPIRRKTSEVPPLIMTEEPVEKVPDVPGDKPETFQFKDWAII